MQSTSHNLSQHLGKLIDSLVTLTEKVRKALEVHFGFNDRHDFAPLS